MVFEDHVLETRRVRVAQALGQDPPLLLLSAGDPISVPGGLDVTYPFIPYPEYYWLTGVRRSGGVLAYDSEHGWTHFVRPVTTKERVWSADIESPQGRDVESLPQWLEECQRDRSIVVIGAPLDGVPVDEELAGTIKLQLDEVRRVKDQAELDLLQRSLGATAAGHRRVQELIQPGVTERELQIEMEAEMFRHGADVVGYGTIVGFGSHAAVLHSEPDDTTLNKSDLVLVDAAGQVSGYTVDVTRTYPAVGRFTPEQQSIYDLVKAALLAATAACRDGVEWHAVHRIAATEIATGLRQLGILRCSADEALENEAVALFFPHGIGHMVGLGVRDVGGSSPGRDDPTCCGVKVRIDLPVRTGYLMTVEPGIYFPKAVVDDPEQRQKFAETIDWERVDQWKGIGGVRLEDNVLITEDVPLVLTESIPK